MRCCSVRNCLDPFPHLAHEPLRVLQHQSIRNPQQVHADGPEVVFFGGVSPRLTWLQVNIAIELDGQATLEALKVNDPLLDATLAAKLHAQPTVAQQVPCRSLSFGLVTPQFADALGRGTHNAEYNRADNKHRILL